MKRKNKKVLKNNKKHAKFFKIYLLTGVHMQECAYMYTCARTQREREREREREKIYLLVLVSAFTPGVGLNRLSPEKCSLKKILSGFD